MMIEKDYFPKIGRASTLQRVKNSLIFVDQEFKNHTYRNLSRDQLDTIFSSSTNEISVFLRKKLLICTDDFYSKRDGVCKEYALNFKGYKEVLDRVIEKDPSFNLDSAEKEYTAIVCDVLNKDHSIKKQMETVSFVYDIKSYRRWNPIQQNRRDIKKRILKHMGLVWDYDVESCALTVLLQKAAKCGMKIQSLKHLSELCSNKNIIRQRIATDVGITVNSVKNIVAAIMNGAKMAMSGDIYKELGRDELKFSKLQTNIIIEGIRSDLSKMWSYITKYIERELSYKKDGTVKPLTAKEKSKEYFKIEYGINDCFIEYCDNKELKYFLQHDGFTSNKRIDKAELEELIYIKTGYRVSLAEKCFDDIEEVPQISGFDRLEAEWKHKEVVYRRKLKKTVLQ